MMDLAQVRPTAIVFQLASSIAHCNSSFVNGSCGVLLVLHAHCSGSADAFLYLYYIGDPTFIKGRGVITPVPGRENM